MLDCLILGDSIAVGIHSARPECVAYTKTGINSAQWNNKFITNNLHATTVIISLGSNDYTRIKTLSELETLREVLAGDRVYWILPANKPDIREMIRHIANRYGDSVITIPELLQDGIHPTTHGYKKIGELTK